MANHLTPTELADEVNMKRQVIAKCMEMGVPIFNGRIDKTLFVSSLRHLQRQGSSRRPLRPERPGPRRPGRPCGDHRRVRLRTRRFIDCLQESALTAG